MWPMGLLIVYKCITYKTLSIEEQKRPFQVCEFEYMKFWTSEEGGRGINPYLEIKYMIGSEVVKEAEMF